MHDDAHADVVLAGTTRWLRLDSRAWGRLRFLARAHGWRPAGTRHPDVDWLGVYDRPCGQEVIAIDAASLARAIGRCSEAELGVWSEAAVSLAALCASGGFAIHPEDAR